VFQCAAVTIISRVIMTRLIKNSFLSTKIILLQTFVHSYFIFYVMVETARRIALPKIFLFFISFIFVSQKLFPQICIQIHCDELPLVFQYFYWCPEQPSKQYFLSFKILSIYICGNYEPTFTQFSEISL